MKAPIEAPRIETLKEAIAIGLAFADVLHYDRGWAERVFQGAPSLTYETGPLALNREIESMWRWYLSETEKLAVIAAYVSYRLT